MVFENENIWIEVVENVAPDDFGTHIANVVYKGIKFLLIQTPEYYEISEYRNLMGLGLDASTGTGYFWAYTIEEILEWVRTEY